MLGQFANPFLAVHRQEDRRHQRDQRLVGTDIRGCLLAPNMLLTRRQRQHKSAIAVVIDRLPHEPPRHLPQVRFLRRYYSAERPAVA
jgi:hypothetical protein